MNITVMNLYKLNIELEGYYYDMNVAYYSIVGE